MYPPIPVWPSLFKCAKIFKSSDNRADFFKCASFKSTECKFIPGKGYLFSNFRDVSFLVLHLPIYELSNCNKIV